MPGLCIAYSRFSPSIRVPPCAAVRANEDGGAEDDDEVEVIPEVARTTSEEGGDVVHVKDDKPDLDSLQAEPALSSAPGVETVYLFPNNPDKSRCLSTARQCTRFQGGLNSFCGGEAVPEIHAGQKTELLVGLINNGQSLPSLTTKCRHV